MNDPNQMPNDPSHAMNNVNTDCSNNNIANNNSGTNSNDNIQQQLDQQETVLRPITNENSSNNNIANNNSGTNINDNIQQQLDQQETTLRPITNENSRKNSKFSNKLSMEDSLKVTDSGGFAMKTPVSLLQEILSRHGITPNYELVQIEGAIHEPTFRYRVSFNDKDVPFTAMGSGRSKKEAKHSAAKSLIDKLIRIQMIDSQENIGSSNISLPGDSMDGNMNTSGSGDGDKVFGNPIGWLQEMCMSRRWPQPTYETETEVGLPHERLFTIACTILNFREVGKGKSKKIAKRVAAHKMWTRLQETPLGNEQIIGTMHSEFESDLKYFHMPTITSQHSLKNSQFHSTLIYLTSKKLQKLQQTCLADTTIDYIALLSELAQENQFEITYVDIEEKSLTNQCQSLVQISTLPTGVCHGCGQTTLDARKEAAHNALEYLKIMMKK